MAASHKKTFPQLKNLSFCYENLIKLYHKDAILKKKRRFCAKNVRKICVE